jgi:ATP-binding cassette subfamily F protein uup
MRLADAIADGRGDWVTIAGNKRHVASYLKDFLFSPEQWRSPVKSLSGGERGRLALAAALAKPSNLLVLDEPTNDLDLETLELLEELLSSYEGTFLLVSHDRSFLDHLVTSVITMDPEKPGQWRRYAGGYDDMVAQRGSAPGAEMRVTPSAPAKQKAAPVKQSRPARQTKLSYKETFALENLPKEIDALQHKIAALKETLADPKLFARDPARCHRPAKDLDAAEQKLAAAEEEWLRLEMKREEIER